MSPGILRDDTAHGTAAPALAALKAGAAARDEGVVSQAGDPIAWPDGQPEELKGLSEQQLHAPVTAVNPKDSVTPDNWVPRHPKLIRLTGRHPFNSEPPLPDLMQCGWLTPTSLHYVRNHGPVPKLGWSSHTLTVEGMVDQPTTFSMDDLIDNFEPHTVMCTLACAGNRRKEQNMVKKTKGFNWGPSATASGAWTGVRLPDLLRACGVHSHKSGARYVHTVGVKGELPQGDGTYGTSIHYSHAMGADNDVIIAYAYNGKLLAPDHGFPIRMLIPGCIGGRMVKWLDKISVLPEPSNNFYHEHDNKVLPAGVDMERANAEGWWSKQDFVINELNVQSVVTSPSHDEVIPLTTHEYTVKGYAYSGGGRKIIRVEVSLDEGNTWLISDIKRFVEPTEHNKHWVWVGFQVKVAMVELLRAREIRCRAVDSSNNLQPETLTWNLMGMLNNPAYRILLKPQAEKFGGIGIHCEHPIKSGGEAGGWMEREALAAAPVEAPAPAAVVDTTKLRTLSPQEIEKHDSHDSAWFIHDGNVYDATKFLKEHPGGAEAVLIVAGQDATEEFNAIHSSKAKSMLKDYLIGKVGAGEPAVSTPERAPEDKEANVAGAALVALNPKKRIAFKLVEKADLSPNTRRFRFALQSPQHKLGLPVGQHMFLYAKDKGETVMRAYTPTSCDDDVGYFELVIKVYMANEHPQFPLGGRMTQVLERLAIGDSMEAKGPLGHFIYKGRGVYSHSGAGGTCQRLSMVAGGTGITPMWQVVQAVLKDPQDRTQIKLIFGNQTEEDILLRDELDELAKDPRFTVHHVLSRVKGCWSGGSTGRVTEALLKEHCFPADDDTLCLLCGPPAMIDQACKPALDKLGYRQDHIIVF